MAVANGAKEIDIVINREMALTGNWKGEDFLLLKNAFLSVKIVYLIFHMCLLYLFVQRYVNTSEILLQVLQNSNI